VQGRLLVKDRGYVSVGQNAKIRLANQDQLKFDSIDAKITKISPDAVQSDSAAWYDIELELTATEFKSSDTTYVLVPGIHVQVYILTGERTVLSYITTPFHNGIGQALQER
jgi:adhesin transport system membrane fusion protein